MKDYQVMNTHEIYNSLKNKGQRIGLSMNTLSNIMARSPHYEKLGYEMIPHAFGSYQIIVWGFRYE
jgi:lambda repressor-like predicted transcriptional regulator